jgi:PAS domain S-box-containing protein
VAITRPQTRPSDQRIFALVAWASTIAALLFVGWTVLGLAGAAVNTAIDSTGEVVSALLAALGCLYAAARSLSPRRRLAWRLLAASALAWGGAEAVSMVYEVGLGTNPPDVSPAAAGFILAIPLRVAAILVLIAAPRSTASRWVLWLHGLIVGLSLLFVAWVLGLGNIETSDFTAARFIDLAYPIGDVLTGTALILAIRRAAIDQQGRLILLLAGLAATMVADSAFSYQIGEGSSPTVARVLDSGWVVGYLMLLTAAMWPPRQNVTARAAPPTDLWQVVLPWLAVLGVGLCILVLALQGRPLDRFLTVLIGVLAVLLMVSQVISHRESLDLAHRNRLFAATLNDVIVHAPLGVMRVGPDRKILQSNPRVAALLRVEGEVVGMPIDRYLPRDELDKLLEQLEPLVHGPKDAVESDIQATRADGTTIWLHWSATAVRDPHGEIQYFIVMLEDNSARHEAETTALANLQVLERLNAMKTQFLTRISHQFRTAMVGIQGFSELVADSQEIDSDEVKAIANDIYSDARALNRAFEEMLELDRLEGGRTTLRVGRVDINELIRSVVSDAQTKEGVTITTDLEPFMPSTSCDVEKVSQVLTTLLSNAIKYSPRGGEVRVRSTSDDYSVRVSFSDQGPGLPADFENGLFVGYQRHMQADGSSSQSVSTGLGLPIARQIIEMHGGRMWYESTPGAGSQFHFTLPTEVRPSREVKAVDRNAG